MADETTKNYCQVCNLTFRDKYTLKRHIETINHKNNLVDYSIMTENKRAKIDKREGLIQRTQEYLSDFDFYESQIVRVLEKEEQLKPDQVNETVEIFETELEGLKSFLKPKKAIIDNIYTGATDIEKSFFRSLSRKNPAVGETTSPEGLPIAGQPASYNLSINDLEQIKIAMEVD